MATRLTLELDAEDLETVESAIHDKLKENEPFGFPEPTDNDNGASCDRGAALAELLRDLEEYRSSWEADHPMTPTGELDILGEVPAVDRRDIEGAFAEWYAHLLDAPDQRASNECDLLACAIEYIAWLKKRPGSP